MTVNLPVKDWAHAAYEAARRRDVEAELGALQPLIRHGRGAVDIAMHIWIARTFMVMQAIMRQKNTRLGHELQMEADDTGDNTPIDQAPPEAVWASRMFMAHTQRDPAMWDALWLTVPHDTGAITEHILALLRATVLTAETWAEQTDTQLYYDADHVIEAVIDADPMLAATRAAMCHYN